MRPAVPPVEFGRPADTVPWPWMQDAFAGVLISWSLQPVFSFVPVPFLFISIFSMEVLRIWFAKSRSSSLTLCAAGMEKSDSSSVGFFFKINFYWYIVDLQCYVSFSCTTK